jgi:hypothetical protein
MQTFQVMRQAHRSPVCLTVRMHGLLAIALGVICVTATSVVRKRARAWINATKFNELSERLLLCLKWSASFMTKHPGVQLKQIFYLPFTEVIHLVACEPFIA